VQKEYINENNTHKMYRKDLQMTLSEKRVEIPRLKRTDIHYREEDVKQSVKDLITKFHRMEIISGDVAEYEIKEIFGEELTK